MKKIYVSDHVINSDVDNMRSQFINSLQEHDFELQKTASADTDIAFCLGGDGALLAGIRKLKEKRFQIPICGIHCSKGLGFLHSLSFPREEENYQSWLKELAQCLKNNHHHIEKRWGLQAVKNKELQSSEHWALNDLVFSKGTLSRMIRLSLKVNDSTVFNNFRGDGMIAASATGSTAYSLAAGGPVIEPELECLVLTPINPHEIAQRPLVLNLKSKISIQVLEGEAYLTEDGQSGHPLQPGDEVEITKADHAIQWFHPENPKLGSKDYYNLLRTKLGFGGKLNAP